MRSKAKTHRRPGAAGSASAICQCPSGSAGAVPVAATSFSISAMSRIRHRGITRRSGISLLEVMFSIGVVMIGLLAAAALLPLAGLQVSKGIIADNAAALGRQAVRDFHVRGMANPYRWGLSDAGGLNFNPIIPVNTPTRRISEYISPEQSFCIDPRFVAAAGANRFPVANGGIWMPRITLASGGMPDGLGSLQADQLFTSQDELVLDLPGDSTLGPVQNFGINGEKRQTRGRMSWMATLVPQLDRQGNPIREYTLSVIVFAQRLLQPAAERVALVGAFYSGSPAWSGGDVLLESRADQPASDLEVNEGDWVLLSGRKLTQSSVRFVPVHKWYQVVAVDEEPTRDPSNPRTSHDLWTRNVTLVGPDWDYGNMVSGAFWEDPAVTTQVTIIPGVVSVFEKTVRLETSSMWVD